MNYLPTPPSHSHRAQKSAMLARLKSLTHRPRPSARRGLQSNRPPTPIDRPR